MRSLPIYGHRPILPLNPVSKPWRIPVRRQDSQVPIQAGFRFVTPAEAEGILGTHANKKERAILQKMMQAFEVTPAAINALLRVGARVPLTLLQHFSLQSRGVFCGLRPHEFFALGLGLESFDYVGYAQPFLFCDSERPHILRDLLRRKKLQPTPSPPMEAGTIDAFFKVFSPSNQCLINLDTETEGLDKMARILEHGFLVVDREKGPSETGSILLRRPGVTIPETARRVHGIATADLTGPDAIEPREFYAFLEDRLGLRPGQEPMPIVTQNGVFDLPKINRELSEFGFSQIRRNRCFDLLLFNKLRFPAYKKGAAGMPESLSLGALVDFFGIDLKQNKGDLHRAGFDCWVTFELLCRSFEQARQLKEPVECLVALSTHNGLAGTSNKTLRALFDSTVPDLSPAAPKITPEKPMPREILQAAKHLPRGGHVLFLEPSQSQCRQYALEAIALMRKRMPDRKIIWLEPNRLALTASLSKAENVLADETTSVVRLCGEDHPLNDAQARSKKRREVWESADVVLTLLPFLQHEPDLPFSEVGLVVLNGFFENYYRWLLPVIRRHPDIRMLALSSHPGSEMSSIEMTQREFEFSTTLSMRQMPQRRILLRQEPVARSEVAFNESLLAPLTSLHAEITYSLLRGGVIERFLQSRQLILSDETQTPSAEPLDFLNNGILLEAHLRLFDHLHALWTDGVINQERVFNMFAPIFMAKGYGEQKARQMALDILVKVEGASSEISTQAIRKYNRSQKMRALMLEVLRLFAGITRTSFLKFVIDQGGQNRFVRWERKETGLSVLHAAAMLAKLEMCGRHIRDNNIEGLASFLARRILRREVTALNITEKDLAQIDPPQRMLAKEPKVLGVWRALKNKNFIFADAKVDKTLDLLASLVGTDGPKKAVVYLPWKDDMRKYRRALQKRFGKTFFVTDDAAAFLNGALVSERPCVLLAIRANFDVEKFRPELGVVVTPVKNPKRLAEMSESIAPDGTLILLHYRGTSEGLRLKAALRALDEQDLILTGEVPRAKSAKRVKDLFAQERQGLLFEWGDDE